MREEKSQKKTAKKTTGKKPKSKPKPRIRSPKKAYNVRKKTAAARLIAQSKEIQDSDVTVSSEDDDEVPCGVCGVMYGTDDEVWIQCSECGLWFHITCVEISKKSVPDVFLCPDCD